MLSGWRAYFLSGAKLQPATEVWVHGAVAASSYVGPFLRKVVKVAAAQFLVYDSSIELQLEIVFFTTLRQSSPWLAPGKASVSMLQGWPYIFSPTGATRTPARREGLSVCALTQQKDTIS